MSQVILGTGRKTSQQEEWLCQSIALVSTRPLQLQALQLREMFDRIKPKLLSQDSDWQKKKIQQFSNFKKTTLWNKISHKDCILGHTDLACRECFIQIWYLLKFWCTHLVCMPLRQLESIKVTWLGDDSSHTCN